MSRLCVFDSFHPLPQGAGVELIMENEAHARAFAETVIHLTSGRHPLAYSGATIHFQFTNDSPVGHLIEFVRAYNRYNWSQE